MQGGAKLHDDYFNLKANMSHEDVHTNNLLNGSTGARENNSWEHIKIHINSIINNPDYSKTTKEYKEFSKSVAKGYLMEMSGYIQSLANPRNKMIFDSNEHIQSTINRYIEAVEDFNNAFNEKYNTTRKAFDEWTPK